jgi:hypothetical protein
MPLDQPFKDKGIEKIQKSRGDWDWSSGKLPDTSGKKKKKKKPSPILPIYKPR